MCNKYRNIEFFFFPGVPLRNRPATHCPNPMSNISRHSFILQQSGQMRCREGTRSRGPDMLQHLLPARGKAFAFFCVLNRLQIHLSYLKNCVWPFLVKCLCKEAETVPLPITASAIISVFLLLFILIEISAYILQVLYCHPLVILRKKTFVIAKLLYLLFILKCNKYFSDQCEAICLRIKKESYTFFLFLVSQKSV